MSARIRPGADQMALGLDQVPVEDPVGPRPTVPDGPWSAGMVPGERAAPFDDEAWFFEPWWPGVTATMVIDEGRVWLRADQLTDPLPAFPELGGAATQVRARQLVIVGTLLVLDTEGRPDLVALRRRLVDAEDRPGTGAFIAADLLMRDGRRLVDAPFSRRRTALLEAVPDGDRFLVSRGLHGEGPTLADAAASMGIESISARRLDAPWHAGPAPDAWLRIPVVATDVGPVRPLLVLLQRLPLD